MNKKNIALKLLWPQNAPNRVELNKNAYTCQKNLLKLLDTLPFLEGLYTFTKMYRCIMRMTMWACFLTLNSLQTSLVMSVYLTISVSVERYISVVYPLLSIRWGIIMWSPGHGNNCQAPRPDLLPQDGSPGHCVRHSVHSAHLLHAGQLVWKGELQFSL